MTAFRSVRLFTISCFGAGLLFLAPLCRAADLTIREAATQSTPSRVSEYRDDFQSARKKGPSAFSPAPEGQLVPRDAQDRTGLRQTAFPDVRNLVRKVNRSVVSIRMLDGSGSWSLGELGLGKGEPGGKAMGYGSGFMVSTNGHIVTNEHVLRNGPRIEVELLDGRKYFAKVLLKDGKNDLALLKIEAPGGMEPASSSICSLVSPKACWSSGGACSCASTPSNSNPSNAPMIAPSSSPW